MEDTIAILRGLKQRYEAHHKVTIGDDALVAAATLSNRYISGRQLPDKAIDLVDEAAAHLRMELDSSPEEIDELQRKVTRLEMEEMQLKKAEDPASKERLGKLQAELADTREKLSGLKARWDAEQAGHNKVGDCVPSSMTCVCRRTSSPVREIWLRPRRFCTERFRLFRRNSPPRKRGCRICRCRRGQPGR